TSVAFRRNNLTVHGRAIHFAVRDLQWYIVSFLPVHRRQNPCRVVLRLSKPDEKGLATSPAPAASLSVQVSSASPWSCRGGHGTRRRSRGLRPQGLRSHIHLDLLGLCFLALRDA